MKHLTDEQLAIVGANDSRLTIEAGAGSGKTLTLVERYLRLVNEGAARPDEILSITFTRKAAAVMKERIVAALNRQGTPELAQIAETGPIQTIHAFCETILRENSLSAGIDPGFAVIEGPTRDEFFRESVRSALTSASQGEEWVMEYIRARTSRRAYNQGREFEAGIVSDVDDVLKAWRGSGIKWKALADLYQSPESLTNWWNSVLTEALPQDQRDLLGKGGFQESFVGLKLALQSAMKAGTSWIDSYSASPGLEKRAATEVAGLAWLALTTWELFDLRMVRSQQFDFPLLEALAVELLQTNEDVATRLRNQYPFILVDEAQDVNPVQDRLISAIRAKSELFVGDPQQSIFGFRLADRQLFIQRGQETGVRRLTKNFRSDPGILAFIDHIFIQIWEDQYTKALPEAVNQKVDPADPFATSSPLFTGVEIWPTNAKSGWGETAALVQELIEEKGETGEIAILMRTAKHFSNLQERLRERGVPSVIVGSTERFYLRMETRDVANALLATARPEDDFALLAFLHSPFVGLSTDAIIFLAAHPPVLEKLGDLPDELANDREKVEAFLTWWKRLETIGDRVPAWEILSELFRWSPYFQNLAQSADGKNKLANVRKLFTLSCGHPEMDAYAFADHIRQIQSVRHREGEALTHDHDQDVVRLMTIHSSKGLEFDTVILPDSSRFLVSNNSGLKTDPQTGLFSFELERAKPLVWGYLRDKQYQATRAEELRLLYVAMTRAKKRLCVGVSESPGDQKVGELLRKFLGYGPDMPNGLVFRGQKVDSEPL